mmetsp:Transcript_35412/g.79953  ORF Transcript_35412/g.79953 Transcript_35412/m.79953 type:complete len:177 (-) Transcript_35412:131-661(-)
MHLPVDDDPPSVLVESQSAGMSKVLLFQMLVCVLRFASLGDVVGGFLNGLTIALGWYAWRQHMNVTIVSVWGIVNAVQMVMDITSGVLTLIFRVLSFQLFEAALIVLCPVSEFIGVFVAWEVFRHHDLRGGDLMPVFKEAVDDAKPLLNKVEKFARRKDSPEVASAAIKLAGAALI